MDMSVLFNRVYKTITGSTGALNVELTGVTATEDGGLKVYEIQPPSERTAEIVMHDAALNPAANATTAWQDVRAYAGKTALLSWSGASGVTVDVLVSHDGVTAYEADSLSFTLTPGSWARTVSIHTNHVAFKLTNNDGAVAAAGLKLVLMLRGGV